jgi:AraC-like DNA-binding protein
VSPGVPGYAVHAHIVTQQFVRHAHAHHVVALVECGALAFSYRGTERVASAGQVVLVNAGEPHTGRAFDDEGCTYWSLAVEPDTVAAVSSALGIPDGDRLRFGDAVLDDRALWWRLARTRNAACTGPSPDEVCTRARDALAWLVTHHMAPAAPHRAERTHVRRAREHLETHYHAPVSLRTLSVLVGRSPFQLARAFHADVGMSPHVYLEQCRVRAACTLLLEGERLSDVAYATGFPDQAHFTRRFKGIMGVTPGAYVRDLLHSMGDRTQRA